MRIIAGHYYKYKGIVYRAELCTFCNMRRVTNYKTCLLELRGRLIPLPKDDLVSDCLTHKHGYLKGEVVESTEKEYVAQQLERRL